ncbi:MAG: dTMP kinase [Candidatus Parvarchaeota archaeon]|nr:dTMP kinase [Candidatus Jingweiarchaeum tengchongense]MCW1304408.1 dTMP kinase [Candidatus Jingweiarchaeum tengchongense]
MKTGKLIVFEGIDGAGCETQTKLLKEFLISRGKNPLILKYPDYSTPLGRAIKEFLSGKFVLTPDVQFLLYSLDIKKDIWAIAGALKRGRDVICDRYFTSTLAYQCSNKYEVSRALKFSKLFEILEPDIVIYLDVEAKIGFERKKIEKEDLDIHERNIKLLNKVRSRYKKLARNNIFAKKWYIVNASKDMGEVHKKIKKIIMFELGIKK